jgi:sigma-E factor negative regulatory protein RseC
MTETDAVVVQVEGDHVLVRAERAGKSCGACTRPGGCQSAGMGSVLDGALGRPPAPGLLRLPNTIHAKPGDAVVLCAGDGTVLRAAWLAYGIPLLLALAGALILNVLTGSDVAAALGMLSGLLGGYFFMHRKGLDSGCAEPILSISFKRTT